MEYRNFDELVKIVKKLRIECPWDKEQTNDSIKANTIEEAFEVVDAIDNKDFDELKKELGDLLLHVIFHTSIAEDNGHFNLEDVIKGITEKLIRRHPHIFGNAEVSGEKDVLKNWESIKLQEGKKSIVQGIPKNIPALYRAARLQEKASNVGFDWENKDDVWKKVIEEIEEMHESEKNGTLEELEGEVGDVLFAMVNYSRFLKVNPEDALRRTNEKFIKRFQFIEKRLEETGKKINEATLQEMDVFWNESKGIVG